LSEEKKKKMYYYYGGTEKRAGEIKKKSDEGTVPYSSGEIQREFNRMMERFQHEFDDFWTMPLVWGHDLRWRHSFPMINLKETMMPSVDVEDRGKDFSLTVDLPGFSKENVEIEVGDDSVVIHAEKSVDEEEKKKNYVRHERGAQTFYRRITMPEQILSDDAKASLTNGILKITVPKKAPKETKKIAIE
jgi:HSP20 family protein